MDKSAQVGIAGGDERALHAAIPLNLAHTQILRELPGGGQRQRVVLTVVMPVCNQAALLSALYARLAAVADGLSVDAEFLFVDDGSSDDTYAVLKGLKDVDGRVAIVTLSRRFGKEAALSAGLDHATGNAVVVMDVAMQEPPELIPELLDRWRQGYDVVHAQRLEGAEHRLHRGFARMSRRLMDAGPGVKRPEGAGDMYLLSRRAVDALKQLKEQHRSMKGLLSWIGFRQIAVPYQCDPGLAGRGEVSDRKRWGAALDDALLNAEVPLKAATGLALLASLCAFAYMVFVTSHGTTGDSRLISMGLFLGGVQLVLLCVVGNALVRLCGETRRRPLYLLDAYQPATSRRATLARQRKSQS